jgi:hypothetical protein
MTILFPPEPATTVTPGPISPQAPLNNEIGLLLGRKGSGKSTLARHLATKTKRTLILDTLGRDYGGGAVVHDRASLYQYYSQVQHQSDFCIIARPRGDDLPVAFFELCKTAESIWMIVDECDRYCGPSQIDPGLYWCLNYGRQFGISVIGCARRAASVNRTWTANADWIVAHQTQEPIDLEYLAKFMDISGLKDLEPFQWRRHGHSSIF